MATQAQKNKPRVGDRAWFVEWCEEIPVNEHGDSDMDAAVDNRRKFATRDEALAFAKEVFPKDAFGSVAFWESEFVAYDEDHAVSHPHVGFWECMREPEYYEGDDASDDENYYAEGYED